MGKLAFATGRMLDEHTKAFGFKNDYVAAAAGLTRFELQSAYDSAEGRHQQIKKIGIDMEVSRSINPPTGSQYAVDVKLNLTMDNSSEGGGLNNTQSSADVLVVTDQLGSLSTLDTEKRLYGPTTVQLEHPALSQVGGGLAGFYTEFSGEDRELERVYAKTSVEKGQAPDELSLHGESGMVDKNNSSLSHRTADVLYLGDDDPDANYEIGEATQKKKGETFNIPNSGNYSAVYAIISEFDVWLDGGQHREIGRIIVDVTPKQSIDGAWSVTPFLEFVGGDDDHYTIDPDSWVSFTWFGILNDAAAGKKKGKRMGRNKAR